MSGVDDRVEGLEAGGDDYLVKPFAFSELTARINALVRRPPINTEKTRLRVGDLEMNLSNAQPYLVAGANRPRYRTWRAFKTASGVVAHG